MRNIKSNRQLDYSKFDTDMTAFVNDNNIKSPSDYLIVTSIKERITYIFEKEGEMWVLIYRWSCTVGKPSTPTIKGVFAVGVKYPAITSEGSKVSAKYATNIVGEYFYHSILYDLTGTYIYDGRLGVAISHGCIRLDTNNARWIFNSVPEGTTIVIN
ncbi:murein L,D-transpeptidase [Romboutsia ilealis]|uniref:L,D-transpeptidase n=1 Tax=Romboutsia faecis TaxID=2764597 RepID=A0ABR7JU60_9FIRM|nr:L,D-transpeptidase [Romboutsia faecis]MBC5998287.1 L,D-transpeptidase [Romboutsia faecis]MRN25925.1 murein L,D-transpeptidase [Romboutsia ilealis]